MATFMTLLASAFATMIMMPAVGIQLQKMVPGAREEEEGHDSDRSSGASSSKSTRQGNNDGLICGCTSHQESHSSDDFEAVSTMPAGSTFDRRELQARIELAQIPYANFEDEIKEYLDETVVQEVDPRQPTGCCSKRKGAARPQGSSEKAAKVALIEELNYNHGLKVVLDELRTLPDIKKGHNDKKPRYDNGDAKWKREMDSSDIKTRALIDDHDVSSLGKGYTIAIMEAQLEIKEEMLKKLPTELRTGLFAQAATYPALIRVSHTWVNGLQLIRFAIKVNLAGSDLEEYSSVMDFLLTETATVFPMANADQLAAFIEMNDSSKSACQKGMALLPHACDLMRMAASSAMNMGSKKSEMHDTSVLGKSYYSMTPYELARMTIMKYAFVSKLEAGSDDARPVEKGENGGEKNFYNGPAEEFQKEMQTQVKGTLGRTKVEFDFKIKVAANKEKHNINDASAHWTANDPDAAWEDMGVLTVFQQTLDDRFVNENFAKLIPSDKSLSFNPAHSPHKPVGDINLFREYVYPRYDALFQNLILGQPDAETNELQDSFTKIKRSGDAIEPIQGAAPTRCPFMAMQMRRESDAMQAEERLQRYIEAGGCPFQRQDVHGMVVAQPMVVTQKPSQVVPAVVGAQAGGSGAVRQAGAWS